MNRGIRVLQTLALPLGYVTISVLYYMRLFRKSPHLFFEIAIPTHLCGNRLWSGQRGSNSLPPPWQGGALPDELCPRTKSIITAPSLFVNPPDQFFLHFPQIPPAAPPPALPPAPPDRLQAPSPPGAPPGPEETRSAPPGRRQDSRAPAT